MRADEGVRGQRMPFGLLDAAGFEQRLGERPLGFAEVAVILVRGKDADGVAKRALGGSASPSTRSIQPSMTPDQAASPAAPASR